MSGEDVNRGCIRHLDRYKQLISYEGMVRRRKITPTDIDGVIDYNGVCFLYIEGKFEDAPMDFGQQKAIEHMVNSHIKAGHPACAIVFRHHCNAETIIVAKDQYVSKIYYRYEWKDPNYSCTVLEFIEKWEQYWDTQKIKI